MNKRILTNKIWLGVLAIFMIFSFSVAGSADAKLRGSIDGTVEAIARASAYTGAAPLQVQFNAGSSIVTEGSIKTCKWEFARGQIQEGMIVNHTFDDPGHYVVNLWVENSLGVFDRDTVYIEVLPRMIHVDDMSISLVSEKDNSLKARVVVTITDANGVPVPDVMVRGKWGGLVRGYAVGLTNVNGKAVLVSNSTDKEGIIRFKVKNVGVAGYLFIPGDNSVKISTDEQSNLAPEVRFALNKLCGPAPFDVIFCGSECYDPDGEIVDFHWDFGDGSQGRGCTCEHVYYEIGIYNARLTITDDHGQKSSGEIMITVTGAPD